jgi:uncharacterized protein YqfA (UPF0365 family)
LDGEPDPARRFPVFRPVHRRLGRGLENASGTARFPELGWVRGATPFPGPSPAPLDETPVNELPSSLPVPVLLGAGLVLGLLALTMLLLIFNYGQLWFQAFWSKAPVRFLELLGMSLRKVNARTIVQGRIMAVQAGLGSDITARRLEAHYLAGGDVPRVIRALIVAHRADLDLDFDRACAIDLAGRDVLDAVQTSVNPKVIDCPDTRTGKSTLSAVAKNGVELKIRARVTVRTNLQQLIGGATEETIIARVGEGIITSIGSSDSHFQVMEHPDTISKAVLQRGLDAQTAFQIVSIDIADIEVGENIGARLQADQAEADTRVARAKAEERRSVAIAREQEMKASTAENRARLFQAEALVPQSIGDAFRAGRVQTQTSPADQSRA